VCAHLGQGRKLPNIERDQGVVVSVEAEGRNEIALDYHLGVLGPARLVAGGCPEVLQQLAELYVVPGAKFQSFDNPRPDT
jgi:hypothetical protein